ncbi:MAG: AIPR family protein [Clostridia bacterium]|nr:AIPR family protein [Clostridia bacterium]
MADINKIVEIYKNEENNFINENSLDSVKTAALYMFYHYYNADVTKLDEINNSFCFLTGGMNDIIAIAYNQEEDNTIDLIAVLPPDIFEKEYLASASSFKEYLKKLNQKVAEIIIRNYTSTNTNVIRLLSEFDINEETMYRTLILTNANVSIDKKIRLQEEAAKYKVKNGKLKIDILFGDDIAEELNDVESPKDSVEEGTLQLYDKNSITYFGEEKSLLTFISAASLRVCYFMYQTKGLFASNLRYFVKSAKIDSKLEETIFNEPENFCYYNNGIIITCDDYKLHGDQIELFNFSIVNGGQTTNIVGRSSFEEDFPIMCKIIKNKYDNLEDKVVFLGKVAEASNTQKPIKAKDLIANRKEQRLLKIQFQEAGIFLQVKRGEKIQREKYPNAWQNAANDQVAQMLYSVVYQQPGAAKNSKSKLLENDKTYDKIFKQKYNSLFFVSLQHIKVAYNDWVKEVKKTEKNGNTKLGLAKNGDLVTPAVIGLIYKLLTSDALKDKIKSIPNKEISSDNEDLKLFVSQNDIGELSLLKKSDLYITGINKKLKPCFDVLFSEILIPAYNSFRIKYTTYAYGNFVKSDYYYYNYVVPAVIKYVKNGCIGYDFNSLFDLGTQSNFDENRAHEESKPGLSQELSNYRKTMAIKEGIEVYMVLKNRQIANIVANKPKNIYDLGSMGKLSESQIIKYGQDICDIVKKYANIQEYMQGDNINE